MILNQFGKRAVICLALLTHNHITYGVIYKISLSTLNCASCRRDKCIAVVHKGTAVVKGVIKCVTGNYLTCLVIVAGTESRSVIIRPRNAAAVLVHLTQE